LEKSIQTEEIPEKEEKCVQTNGDILKTVEAQVIIILCKFI